jgi:peptidoglycan/LPS O-acetylase OafA/YrhL
MPMADRVTVTDSVTATDSVTDSPGGESRARTSATGKDRISALDGLRAVSLLILMGYHFGVGWLQGGFFGLDIFYVLSGYLITGLLLGEYRRRGGVKLSAFWLRRARRLLPALVIVLVVVALMVRFAEPQGLFPDFRISALSALFYFSNWWQIVASSNYFTTVGPVYPLAHTWSLAVEEQFYLVWPLVVVAVMHLSRTFVRGIKVLLILSAVGAAASAFEMAHLYGPSANLTRLYFGTDTHAQSILIGAVLACSMTLIEMRRGTSGMAPAAASPVLRWFLTALAVAGFAGMLTLTYTLVGTSSFDYRGGFALSGLSAAAMIIGAVCVRGGPIARLLSWRPLVWMGTVSYGAYLWHYPVFVFLDFDRTGLFGLPLLAVRFALTFVLAALSYYLVERPVMMGTFWRTLKAIPPYVAMTAVTVVVVLVATLAPGVEVPADATTSHAIKAEEQAIQVNNFDGAGNRVRVLIVGDSLSLTVAVGLARYAQDYGVDLGGRSHTGCGVAVALPVNVHGVVGTPFPGCPMWPTWWTQDVKQLHPQVVGLVIGWWETADRMYQGRWQHLGDPAFDAYETAQLEKAVTILSSQGARVALFAAPYFHSGDQPNGEPWDQDAPERVDRLNQIMASVARRHPGVVSVIPLHKYLDPHGTFTWSIDGNVVRQPDGIHTTLATGTYLAPLVLPKLAELGRRPSAAARTSTRGTNASACTQVGGAPC